MLKQCNCLIVFFLLPVPLYFCASEIVVPVVPYPDYPDIVIVSQAAACQEWGSGSDSDR